MSWPGKEADDWWDSLPVDRKEQIHRWVTPRRQHHDLPDEQLELLTDLPEASHVPDPR